MKQSKRNAANAQAKLAKRRAYDGTSRYVTKHIAEARGITREEAVAAQRAERH